MLQDFGINNNTEKWNSHTEGTVKRYGMLYHQEFEKFQKTLILAFDVCNYATT